MQRRSPILLNALSAAALTGILSVCLQPIALSQKPTISPTTSGAPTTGSTPGTGGAPKTGGTTGAPGNTTASNSAIVQVKKDLTGDFTYRFVSDKDQTSAPAPFPATSSANAASPLAVPSTIPLKSAILEVVDKTRGNVARVSVASGAPVTLTEASFKYIQTVYVSVQHEGKAVSDVLVTIADAEHKYSMAWPLKQADKGIAQFANVPMGIAITVAVNGAGHPSISQTSTLVPGHPADGYHWPTMTVDWADVATVNPAPAPGSTSNSGGGSDSNRSDSNRSDRDNNSNGRDNGNGGGAFSSIVNTLLGLIVVAGVIYLAVWAFNKGHLKKLLDRAGINTAEAPASTGTQASPFDKPARAPLTPITEGTADPLISTAYSPTASAVVATGPRLVATAGSYSGTIFPINNSYAEIGRDPNNGVPLPNDTNSSRKHATISASGSDYSVTDNGSSNGTFLNGVRIPANTPQVLRVGDEVQIGMTRFRFEA